jgi:hypothetical protein
MQTKNRTLALELTTSNGTIYTVPDNHEAEIQSVVISNVAGAKRTFNLDWYDLSATTYYALASGVPIEANSILQITSPLWLVQGESLRGLANVNSSVVITVYVKEYYVPKQF